MSNNAGREPMLDMFIFETFQLIEQLEVLILNSKKAAKFSESNVKEIFRIMHTIKGSSAMMLFNNISTLAHTLEGLFYYIREKKEISFVYSELADIVLKCVDFIRNEAAKIDKGLESKGDSSELIGEINNFLNKINASNNNVAPSAVYSSKTNKTEECLQYYIVQDKKKDQI